MSTQEKPKGAKRHEGKGSDGDAKSAAKPREHWRGPPEVMEGPGADGPLRAGTSGEQSVRVRCRYSSEFAPLRPRRVRCQENAKTVVIDRQRAARLDHDQPSIPRPFSGV